MTTVWGWANLTSNGFFVVLLGIVWKHFKCMASLPEVFPSLNCLGTAPTVGCTTFFIMRTCMRFWPKHSSIWVSSSRHYFQLWSITHWNVSGVQRLYYIQKLSILLTRTEVTLFEVPTYSSKMPTNQVIVGFCPNSYNAGGGGGGPGGLGEQVISWKT